MLFICWEESLSATTGHLRLLGLLTCPSVPANTETWGLFPSKEAPNILVLVITQEPCICYFQRGIRILSLHSLKITSVLPLYTPQKKNSSATSLLKTVSCTVHCFALTYSGFSPREPGGAPQSPGYPKRTSFLSQLLGIRQGSSAAGMPESLNRKSQTGAKVGDVSPLLATEVLMKLHIIPVL